MNSPNNKQEQLKIKHLTLLVHLKKINYRQIQQLTLEELHYFDNESIAVNYFQGDITFADIKDKINLQSNELWVNDDFESALDEYDAASSPFTDIRKKITGLIDKKELSDSLSKLEFDEREEDKDSNSSENKQALSKFFNEFKLDDTENESTPLKPAKNNSPETNKNSRNSFCPCNIL